jgi:release factor glutamine methyltransferase
VILSNPPYIPSNEWLSLDPEIQTYEPRQALDGGENGITFYKKIYQVAWPRLKPGGLMALETHCERQRAVLMEEIFVSEVKKHWIEDCHLLIEKKD